MRDVHTARTCESLFPAKSKGPSSLVMGVIPEQGFVFQCNFTFYFPLRLASRPSDFISNNNGCALQPDGRKSFLRAWEQRLDQLYTHPDFNYRCSWRTILRIQSRLLARWLRGDIPHWSCPVVR